MAPFKNVMLIGAGGNLGLAVLQEFLHTPFEVSVLSREESTSKFPEGVPVIKADYNDPLSLKSAMKGQDVVISMVGGAVAGDQTRFIDAAIAAGVKRFFPSEFGPNTQDSRINAIIPILSGKVAAVNYLRSKESEISWSALVTGAWFAWRSKEVFLNFDIPSKTANLVDGGNYPFTTTTLPKVGKALIAILQHAESTKNQYVYVSSFHVSQKDVLAMVEKVDGRKWTVKNHTSGEMLAKGYKRLQENDYNGIMDLVVGSAFGSLGLGDTKPAEHWNGKLGLEKEDLEQAVKAVLAK